MNEIQNVKAEFKSSVERLEALKAQEWDTIKDLMYLDLEDPMNDEAHRQAIEAHTLSIHVINMLIELSRNGIDLLGDLNNQDIAIKTVLKT